ncbi:DUF1816 domain-containing protein [Gloeocapsopsis crepidinum LEGE 06123]|uniref:DUF1816 domain-containing protein n=1 Tax=Gloeocapsopsis crepidinum LEGE 06123 TaxID=588587 RepID=A0ABR9UVR2_9CHRO|nr:DUF1816 domain-containing protein [Gloeocapsopsis crepidinum]MBE9192390.1 DUF1816 domain-containing protein [Gloeocapsopsis crepidinum LEGE 06123]
MKKEYYVEDLIQKGAITVSVEINHCRPKFLNISEKEEF